MYKVLDIHPEPCYNSCKVQLSRLAEKDYKVAEKRLDINGKTLTYNTCNAREVYAAIQQFFPGTAKDWTPELVFPFLPTGADAEHWCQKTLPNAEYNLNKKRKRSRRGPGKPPAKHNPAEAVTRRATTDALFDK